MHGSDRVPDLRRLRASLGWTEANHPRERNGALLRVLAGVCFENCLTPPTLSERRCYNNHHADLGSFRVNDDFAFHLGLLSPAVGRSASGIELWSNFGSQCCRRWAMDELERLQRRRRGEAVLPPVSINVGRRM